MLRYLNALFLALLFTLSTSAATAKVTITYFHNDISGNPMLATDAAGKVVWKESYRPYGQKLRDEPASRDGKNKIGYAGSPFDASTGLSYMGARYYDPVIGRFMGVDPVGFQEGNVHSFNRYAYANNNPYKYVDRNGQYAELAFEAVSITLGFKSLIANLQSRNYGAAAVDGLGIAADVVGTAIPAVPGVASLGIQASRKGTEKTLYHYTDATGAKAIAETGIIIPNAKGQVFLTDQKMSKEVANNRLFTRGGEKGSHVVEITPASNLPIRPGKNSNELIHQGSIRDGRQGEFNVKSNDY